MFPCCEFTLLTLLLLLLSHIHNTLFHYFCSSCPFPLLQSSLGNLCSVPSLLCCSCFILLFFFVSTSFLSLFYLSTFVVGQALVFISFASFSLLSLYLSTHLTGNFYFCLPLLFFYLNLLFVFFSVSNLVLLLSFSLTPSSSLCILNLYLLRFPFLQYFIGNYYFSKTPSRSRYRPTSLCKILCFHDSLCSVCFSYLELPPVSSFLLPFSLSSSLYLFFSYYFFSIQATSLFLFPYHFVFVPVLLLILVTVLHFDFTFTFFYLLGWLFVGLLFLCFCLGLESFVPSLVFNLTLFFPVFMSLLTLQFVFLGVNFCLYLSNYFVTVTLLVPFLVFSIILFLLSLFLPFMMFLYASIIHLFCLLYYPRYRRLCPFFFCFFFPNDSSACCSLTANLS